MIPFGNNKYPGKRILKTFEIPGVFVASILPFLPSINGQFLNWDDLSLLLINRNYQVLDFASISWMFRTNFLGHYMPLTWLSYALDYKFWELNPFGYHLMNLFLHGCNAVGVFVLVSKWNKKSAALVATLLWAWHPLRVETVAWVTARRDLLATFFVLLAFIFFTKSESGSDSGNGANHRKWRMASFGAFGLSLLSNGSVVPFPFILLFVDVWRVQEKISPMSLRASLIKNRWYFYFSSVSLSWPLRAF